MERHTRLPNNPLDPHHNSYTSTTTRKHSHESCQGSKQVSTRSLYGRFSWTEFLSPLQSVTMPWQGGGEGRSLGSSRGLSSLTLAS